MNFEWDEKKNQRNVVERLISFEEATRIFEGAVLTVEDDRFDYGEIRHVSFGELVLEEATVVLAVVHTLRGENIRIISARKASRKERRLYYEHVH